jgi:DNA-binding GntR family transcriptional regulator
MSIVVRTLSEQVFEIIRERVITGMIPRNVPIRQDALANELGVSKIPLREALARLEQEGLLTSQANRGYFVRPMSTAEAEELFELRLLLEPPAAALGAANADENDRAATLEAFEALDSAASNNLASVASCNRTFHTALVRPSGRVLTTQLVERLTVLSERYVIAHLKPAGREHRAHLEHRDLLDAWLAGDGATVERLLAAHIQATLDDLRAEFGTEPAG